MPSRCYPYPCPGCRTPESVQAPDRYCGSCIADRVTRSPRRRFACVDCGTAETARHQGTRCPACGVRHDAIRRAERAEHDRALARERARRLLQKRQAEKRAASAAARRETRLATDPAVQTYRAERAASAARHAAERAQLTALLDACRRELEATVPVPGGATHRTDGTLRRTPFQRAAA